MSSTEEYQQGQFWSDPEPYRQMKNAMIVYENDMEFVIENSEGELKVYPKTYYCPLFLDSTIKI